ncbi:efflux transporter outer membrane subunit [Comamonas guangdongensis]|uniref:Efflux transporter outer membrane subunit n=1 Tax=Comamonas guangdongensis TaxID=510515 RepID=A0ABV3ZXW0_9BURK
MRSLSLLPVPLLGALALSGCSALGPDYAGPPDSAPTPTGFARAGDDAAISSAVPLARWWLSLGDAKLNDLIERALAANPGLDAARARLRNARLAMDLELAARLPTAGLSTMAAKVRVPDVKFGEQNIASQWLSLYTLGANASWEADLFGSHARSVQVAGASAQATAANLADVQLSLTAEVAQNYVALRAAQKRLALSREAVARQERMLALMQQRYRGGTASRLDLSKLANQLDSTRTELPAQQADIETHGNALAVLLGQAPGSLDAELAPAAELPLPPAAVAIGDPAGLLRRRPDVRAAERTLAARTAQIGVAEAAKFPQLKFSGMLGLGGSSISDLAHLGDFTLALLPQLSWSFLDFGRTAARVSQAEANRDEALAQYRSQLLAALKDAENALSRFGHRRMAVAGYARAKASADEVAALTGQRQRGGTASTLELLDAERQQILAEQNLLGALAGLNSDYIGLQKALGLGWEASPG